MKKYSAYILIAAVLLIFTSSSGQDKNLSGPKTEAAGSENQATIDSKVADLLAKMTF